MRRELKRLLVTGDRLIELIERLDIELTKVTEALKPLSAIRDELKLRAQARDGVFPTVCLLVQGRELLEDLRVCGVRLYDR